jgi:hypothetical protein
MNTITDDHYAKDFERDAAELLTTDELIPELITYLNELAERLGVDTSPSFDCCADLRTRCELVNGLLVLLDRMSKRLDELNEPKLWTQIGYGGFDQQGFAEQVRAEFGFDPSADPLWGVDCPGRGGHSYRFTCPPGILNAIRARWQWEIGS